MLRVVSKRRLRELQAAEHKAGTQQTAIRCAKIAEHAAYKQLADTHQALITARNRIAQLERALDDTQRPVNQWETRGGKPDATP